MRDLQEFGVMVVVFEFIHSFSKLRLLLSMCTYSILIRNIVILISKFLVTILNKEESRT